MANVTGKVTSRLTYKGETYEVDDSITMDAKHAARYEKLNYVKFNREAETKIETVQAKVAAKKQGA